MTELAINLNGGSKSLDSRGLRVSRLDISGTPNLYGTATPGEEARTESIGRRLLGLYLGWRNRIGSGVGSRALRAIGAEAVDTMRQVENVVAASSEDAPSSPQNAMLSPVQQDSRNGTPRSMVDSVIVLDDVLEGHSESGGPPEPGFPSDHMLPGSSSGSYEFITLDQTPIFRDLLAAFEEEGRAHWYRTPLPTPR